MVPSCTFEKFSARHAEDLKDATVNSSWCLVAGFNAHGIQSSVYEWATQFTPERISRV